MIDKNNLPEENNNQTVQTKPDLIRADLPVVQAGDINQQQNTILNNQPETPVAQTPVSTPVESVTSVQPQIESSVIIPRTGGGGVPKWFYFVFGITIIVFILVTYLLVMQFTQKPAVVPEVIPTPSSRTSITVEVPTPTLISPGIASGSASLKLDESSTNDEISSIEADLGVIDIDSLDKEGDLVDKEFNKTN